MVPNRIQVAIGEGVVASAPGIVLSSGLGSCVAVILYDTRRKIGALAHIMLPAQLRNAECGMRNEQSAMRGSAIRNPKTTFQFADTAIAVLLERLQSRGAVRRDIVAKMVGGARMFSCYENPDTGIGKQNITSVRHILQRERIALIGEDTGGHHGRSVEFHLDSGRVIVTAIGREKREI
jgi:chemotaxis protein CheD